MTVAELMKDLASLDGTTLVCIDTLGFHRGIFPVADAVEVCDSAPVPPDCELRAVVVLSPSEWP